jgi:D-sedoheptulose 7-phosphate isomerase
MSQSISAEQLAVEELRASARVHEDLIEHFIPTIVTIAHLLLETIERGGRVFLFGNGGSAADAQHVAAELVSRFRRKRRALPAMALTTDTSILTGIGNDFGYSEVFARQIEALAGPKDLAVGISTSGEASNVLRALETARRMGARTLAFTGNAHGSIVQVAEVCFEAPSQDTARIQEAHLVVWHAVCEIVDAQISAET